MVILLELMIKIKNMKNQIVLMKFLLVGLGLSFLTSCQKEKILTDVEVPMEIEKYVTEHFSDANIIQVKQDPDGLTKNYDVILNNNTTLEFNNNMEIIDIDASSELPDSVIPERLRMYVDENFPNSIITDWQIEDRNQQIKLDNDMDLEFSMQGDFIRIDD